MFSLWAQAAVDPFTVRGVRVDETADSAARAREVAIATGQRKAFAELVDRLVLDRDAKVLPSASEIAVDRLVQDLTIEGEQRSAVRYIATMTVRFRPDAVRALFEENDVGFSDRVSPPVLVLPVHIAGERARLWDEPNPWLRAWQRLPFETGLLPIEVPFGDLGDVSAIDAAAALASNQARLSAISQRYDAPRVAVIRAEPFGGDAPEGLALTMLLHGPQGLEQTQTYSIARRVAPADETELYIAAVRETVERIEEDWKQRSVLDAGLVDTLYFQYSIDGLDDWVAMRQRLEGVGAVLNVRLRAVSRSDIEGALDFRGDRAGLDFALRQAQLALSPLRAGSAGPTIYRLREASPDVEAQQRNPWMPGSTPPNGTSPGPQGDGAANSQPAAQPSPESSGESSGQAPASAGQRQ
jgi:hypothetical protein